MPDTKKIVDKAWNHAHVPRDDGLSYMAYTEQITFLLFLKMADEQSKPPYNKTIVPKGLDWASLLQATAKNSSDNMFTDTPYNGQQPVQKEHQSQSLRKRPKPKNESADEMMGHFYLWIDVAKMRRWPGRLNKTAVWLAVAVIAFICHVSSADEVKPTRTELDLDNPHKGFMLWGTDYAAGAPQNFHGSSIFHVYVPWREVETADEEFRWDRFEKNHMLPILKDYPEATFVLRPVADYPNGANSGITDFYRGNETQRDYPKFIEQKPLEIGFTDYESCNGDGPGRTPDWNDAKMIKQLTQFIAEFGARYDGDPRITCVQTGLLGLWGEWHQSGCNALGPKDAVKEAVRDAYSAAFKQTPVQTRYPRKPDAVGVEFGFYEDFFPSFTAPCEYGFAQCSDDGNWNMHWCFENLTPGSKNNWLTSPISGESPLDVQKKIWVDNTQNILRVLRDYHFSILGPAGAHEWNRDHEAMANIKRTLGYNYHIDSFKWPDKIVVGKPFEVTLAISNTGSAPCYHSMPVELALCDGKDLAVWTGRWAFDLRTVHPNKTLHVTETFTVEGIEPASYSIRLGISNPRRNHKIAVLIQSEGRDPNKRYHLGKIRVSK